MDTPFLISAAALIVYACRLSGFVSSLRQTSPTWHEFFEFVPVAVFTALTVSSLIREPELISMKIAALIIAGGVIWRTRRFGLAVLVGMGTLWLFTLLTA